MRFLKNSFFLIYYTSHLFIRRCATHCRSCEIAFFTHHIYFSTGIFAFICLAFIFAYTVTIIGCDWLESAITVPQEALLIWQTERTCLVRMPTVYKDTVETTSSLIAWLSLPLLLKKTESLIFLHL